MGFFARPDDLVRIDFDEGPLDGEWIMVRRRLSAVEINRLSHSMVTGMTLGDDGAVSGMATDTSEVDLHKMMAWVKRWSLTDDSGRETSPNRARLETLLPEYADQILAAIDKHSADTAAGDVLATDPLPESGSGLAIRSRTRAPRGSGTLSPEPQD